MKKAGVAILLAMLAMPAFGQGVIPIRRATAAAGVDACDDVANLVLWLDATTGITEDVGVTSWADQSTTSNDCTQTTNASEPTLTSSCQNSLDCVSFDGTDDYLTCGANLGLDPKTEDFTIVAVHHLDSGIHAIFGTAAGTGDLLDFKIANNPNSNHRVLTGSTGVADVTSVSNATTVMVALTFNNTSSTTFDFSYYINGASGTSGSDIFPRDEPTGDLFIGTDNAGDGAYGNGGDIMELCIYSRVLTSTEIDNLESALNTKWSVY